MHPCQSYAPHVVIPLPCEHQDEENVTINAEASIPIFGVKSIPREGGNDGNTYVLTRMRPTESTIASTDSQCDVSTTFLAQPITTGQNLKSVEHRYDFITKPDTNNLGRSFLTNICASKIELPLLSENEALHSITQRMNLKTRSTQDSPEDDSKLRGGMDTSRSSDENEIVLATYNGLRIDNHNNNCYLNTAVNNICCNDIIMTEINNRPSLRDWQQQMLLEHKPECTLETIPNAYHDFIPEFRRFLASSTGCIHR